MALTITSRVVGDTVVLDLAGRLWVLDLPLRDRVRELLDEGVRFYVLNLERVQYVDSSGLGQLIALWTSVRMREGNLCILLPTPRVQRLLKVTRLNVIFDILEEEEKAKVAVRRGT
jgi:anti-anti-sigma factor